MNNISVDVSIIIVCWNSSSYIKKCLKSIYTYTRNKTFEVIVVDNGSTDNTVDVIQGGFPMVSIIKAGSNLGFPRANNVALRWARGRFLFLLNPDTRFASDVVGALTCFLESHSDVGAVSPKILETNGNVSFFSAREFPSLSNTFFIQFGLRKLFPEIRLFSKGYLGGWDRDSVKAVPCLTGAALMIPKVVLDKVGFLDEQIPMYFEDIDICARIAAIGKLLYYVPSAVLVHIGGKSADLSPIRSLLFALENGHAPWLYMRKYKGNAHASLLTLIIYVANTLRLLALPAVVLFAIFKRVNYKTSIKRHVVKSLALVKWSLTSKKKFEDRLSGIFPKESHLSSLKIKRQLGTGFQQRCLHDEIND
jgi:GT2 family glycosyltransferase